MESLLNVLLVAVCGYLAIGAIWMLSSLFDGHRKLGTALVALVFFVVFVLIVTNS